MISYDYLSNLSTSYHTWFRTCWRGRKRRGRHERSRAGDCVEEKRGLLGGAEGGVAQVQDLELVALQTVQEAVAGG